MTDTSDPRRRDPQAPVTPDAMRDSIGAGSMRIGGSEARDPGHTAPDATLPGAGLTDHDQPAEGGREEPEEDRPGGSRGD